MKRQEVRHEIAMGRIVVEGDVSGEKRMELINAAHKRLGLNRAERRALRKRLSNGRSVPR